MIPAVPADLPEIEAFLNAHVERSMFPLINLRDHGFDGQGHARRALALHLAHVQKTGVQKSGLFSASDAARRAYEAIGYREDGSWTLRLFKSSARVA